MSLTLGFDVYGTLIDTQGITVILEKFIGNKASVFSLAWRNKQLEYSFRRGLMQNYQDFTVCTREALDFTCLSFNVLLSREQKKVLLEGYKSLPCFNDVRDALKELKANGHKLYAFSNGRGDAVEKLLVSAGIRSFFIDVISCDDLKSFKPNPAVYEYFLRQTNASEKDAWLISSNSFDVTGAISAGLRAAWVKRSEEMVFDPWEIQPTMTISSLEVLNDELFLT